ncbi:MULTISPECIES: hypothetical protein [Pseudomonas]|uniref:hypothetical protein n=1 Tax=Pseudomonas TaxID=286 RepID=UPI00114D3CEB|nr:MULTISPECIES: hypothetical protein [Pseudomonas]MBH3433401.1 hypothetical protein [Pseudomonas citronellolis]
MREQIKKSISSKWLSLDAWSETYVGARWLLVNELPDFQYKAEVHHGALAQMVLLAAHSLVEIMFFSCVDEVLSKAQEKKSMLDPKYRGASFTAAFKSWPIVLVGSPFDLTVEPYKSALLLARRRNATVHKESALATVEMARSAVYSAVEASKMVEGHLLGRSEFKYCKVISKYPLKTERWFSDVSLLSEEKE